MWVDKGGLPGRYAATVAAGERAVVLAGGKGTRLRPYTALLPKPLVPLGDRPILDIVLRQLHSFGFDRVTITTGYLGGLIEAYFGTGEAQGLQVDYFREQEPLGTVGALALVQDLPEDFLVINGDVLTDLDFGELLSSHRRHEAMITIATCNREVTIPLGVLRHEDPADPTRLTAYVEKPSIPYEASMGVYCVSRRVLDHLVPGDRVDFPDLVLRLIEADEVVRAFRPEGAYWLDIGTLGDYERALEDIDTLGDRLLPGGGGDVLPGL